MAPNDSTQIKDIRSCTIAACIFLFITGGILLLAGIFYSWDTTATVFSSFTLLLTLFTHIFQYILVRENSKLRTVTRLLSILLSWNHGVVILLLVSLIIILILFTIHPLTFHMVSSTLKEDFTSFLVFLIPISLILICFTCSLDIQHKIRAFIRRMDHVKVCFICFLCTFL